MHAWRAAARTARALSRGLCAGGGADALVVAGGADAGAASAVTAAGACVAGRGGGGGVDVLVAGRDASAGAAAAAHWDGVRRVFAVDAAPLAENVAAAVGARAGGYAYLVAPASTFGKNVLPRVAGALRVAAVSDVVGVGPQSAAAGEFTRPVYAGNALATVRSTEALRVLTVRATSFAPARAGAGGPAPVVALDVPPEDPRVRFVRAERTQSARPELATASVVVAGGRALKSRENFAILEEIADALGGAVGATRAAVDAGFCPNDMQIGQTGKIIAPELYIAVGISGAIQHLAGMKESKVIVAVNKDPEAPIFQVADYGIVGDLFDILPKLKEGLQKIAAEKGG